jgi:glycosyltransferase involved in cell wall biosynthesis
MKITFLNQCFYPDVAATGQLLTDVAVALAERGHEVTVITGSRGYDNPQIRFAKRERWQGVDVVRLPSSAFGKKARWRRALDFATLLIVYALRLTITPRQDVVVALTSPPLIAFVASLFAQVKGERFVYWIMDLNPDEALAAGWLREDKLITRLLDGFQNFALRRAQPVVALDRFMHARIASKGISPERLEVVRLWPHDAVAFDQSGRRSFRLKHQLDEKFVVMYAGNHSPCHPLETLLKAADQLRDQTGIVFCFVGGGSETGTVKQFAAARSLENILCLPYQPREELAASLSAADLHVVVMGEPFVGIVHPCKIYNVLRVASPFLYIGPAESHVTDLVRQMNGDVQAYVAEHGAVNHVAQQISDAATRHGTRPSRKTAITIPGDGLEKLIEIIEATGASAAEDDAMAANSRQRRRPSSVNTADAN